MSARMKVICHFTARVYPSSMSLCADESAAWLWGRLREAFRETLAAALMPNHFHLVTLVEDVERARWQLANLLGGLRRSHGPCADFRWEPVPRPQVFEEPQKAARIVRYTVLNPSRAKLVRDPLAWPWTTHRDVVGAVADPWVTPERLAEALGRPVEGFAEWMHAYVSGDSSVAVAGTPFPKAAAAAEWPVAPLGSVIEAAAACTRGLAVHVLEKGATRDAFLRLAIHAGWRDVRLLARVCKMTPRGVRWNLRHIAWEGLDAAALCLGDARLRAIELPMPTSLRALWG